MSTNTFVNSFVMSFFLWCFTAARILLYSPMFYGKRLCMERENHDTTLPSTGRMSRGFFQVFQLNRPIFKLVKSPSGNEWVYTWAGNTLITAMCHLRLPQEFGTCTHTFSFSIFLSHTHTHDPGIHPCSEISLHRDTIPQTQTQEHARAFSTQHC